LIELRAKALPIVDPLRTEHDFTGALEFNVIPKIAELAVA
jgi:hypothetical protein